MNNAHSHRKYATFPFKDEIGKVYGKLTVLNRVGNKFNGSAHWLCKCECGNEKIISGSNLRAKHIISCGCVAREKNIKLMKIMQEKQGNDGRSRHELFETWRKMIQRCENVNHPAYKYYGARGITVCEEWKSDFWRFVSDMMPRPFGLTLDRKDNNLGYFKDNCTWATYTQQNNNRRVFGCLKY